MRVNIGGVAQIVGKVCVEEPKLCAISVTFAELSPDKNPGCIRVTDDYLLSTVSQEFNFAGVITHFDAILCGKMVPALDDLEASFPGVPWFCFSVPAPTTHGGLPTENDPQVIQAGTLYYGGSDYEVTVTNMLHPRHLHACHAGVIVHARKQWATHEVGYVTPGEMDKVWDAATEMGFQLVPLPAPYSSSLSSIRNDEEQDVSDEEGQRTEEEKEEDTKRSGRSRSRLSLMSSIHSLVAPTDSPKHDTTTSIKRVVRTILRNTPHINNKKKGKKERKSAEDKKVAEVSTIKSLLGGGEKGMLSVTS